MEKKGSVAYLKLPTYFICVETEAKVHIWGYVLSVRTNVDWL